MKTQQEFGSLYFNVYGELMQAGSPLTVFQAQGVHQQEDGRLFNWRDFLGFSVVLFLIFGVLLVFPAVEHFLIESIICFFLGMIFPRYWGRVFNSFIVLVVSFLIGELPSSFGLLFGAITFEIGLTLQRFVALRRR